MQPAVGRRRFRQQQLQGLVDAEYVGQAFELVAAEARGFATNAWVIEHFMQKKTPAVAKHLMSMNWWPDMYMQKLCVGANAKGRVDITAPIADRSSSV